MAAPAWVQNRGSISNPPLLPTGITVGNLLLMTVWLTSNGSTGTLNTPSGWTSIVDGTTLFGYSSRCRLYVFAKIAAAGETAPTFVNAGGPISAFQTEVSEISGAALPLVGVGGVTSAGTSVAVPAITTPNVDNLVVYVLGSNTDFDEVTAYPAGSTGRVHHQDATVGSYVAIADKAQATAGTVAASSFTRNHTQYPAIAHSLAVPPPAAAAPVADFTGTPLTGTRPLSVAFTDASTNTPTSWAWTFGDGGTSTAQNPTHSYTAAGTYTVALVATNAGGSNTKTRVGYVTVADPSGRFSNIKFGTGLQVTDEGGGVIRVDVVP